MAEVELENLLKNLQSTPESDRDYSQIYRFFSKAVQSDTKIQVTDSLSPLIGFLSMIDEGRVWPIAKNTLAGFQQHMIVPPLQVSRDKYTPKRPRRIPMTGRTRPLPKTLYIQPPATPRMTMKTTYLKQITDRDILPKLVFSPEKSLYYCTSKTPKTARVPSSLSYKIFRKKNPISPPTTDLQTLTLHGLFRIEQDKTGEFMPLKSFLNFKESVYMTQQLPVFQNWYRNKAFIKWYYKLRVRRHKKTIMNICETCPFESTVFTDFYLKIRQHVFTVFQTVHPISPDLPSEAFKDLKDNTEQSIESMRKQIATLTEDIQKDLEHFFEQIRGIAFLLRSDYEILKRIGALPKSLLPYAAEEDSNCPSITALKERNQTLLHERTLAYERKEYLPRFFNMVRLFLRDFTSGQLAVTLSELYSRFDEENPKSSNLINLFLDEKLGLRMEPTLEDFLDWFVYVDSKIWTLYLTYTVELSPEAKRDLFENPDGTMQEVPVIRAEKKTIMQPAITAKKEQATAFINHAYEFLEKRLEQPREFFLKTMARIEEVKSIKSYDNSDDFVKLMAELKKMRIDIECQTRMITIGSFVADMKIGKTSLMKLLTVAMDETKEIGIAKAQDIYEKIQEHRKRYVAETSKPQNNTPQEARIKKEILTDILNTTNEFITIMTSLQSNWTEGLQDLNEKFELVKEVNIFAQNGLKKKKVKRKVKKVKEPEPKQEENN